MNKLCTMLFVCLIVFSINTKAQSTKTIKEFKAGAATTVISPQIGYSINGSMQDGIVKKIHDDTHARAIVIDDGQTKLAFVVMDLCMIYRETIDKAKIKASQLTGIPIENMLFSATHTHSAGTACGVFQSEPKPDYLDFLVDRAAEALVLAYKNMVPATITWGVGEESSEVFNRRWYMKPGTAIPNPFGSQDQVKMNPGVGNPNLLKPAGPIDPDVPTIFLKTVTGKPIAVLANYSLHYVGGTGPGEISADYYGRYADHINELVHAKDTPEEPTFVGIMTNGTSGNINNINWHAKTAPTHSPYEKIDIVAKKVAQASHNAIIKATQQNWVSLAASQTEISLGVRKPDINDVKRAKKIVKNAKGPNMQSLEEIYARETLLLNDYPDSVDIILQVFRIGDMAITAI
ncbi:MAG: neutral/alkaline non-lysosomal ceramidase N-terminal domain-containing protein, partial [Sphingobacterium sp.]